MSRRASKLLIYSILCLALAIPFAAHAAAPTNLIDINTYAGTGDYSAADGDLTSAAFRTPYGITVMQDGSLLVTGSQSHLIRQVKDGKVSVYAGITFTTDARGLPVGGLIDGKKNAAVFQSPKGIATDTSGNIYIADADNNAIRKIDRQGNVTTVAGSPIGELGHRDGAAGKALFYHPSDIAIAADGTIFVADTLNHAIRKVSTSGQVTTLNALSDRAVLAYGGEVEPAGDHKDGKLAEAKFNEPVGLALDAKGNLYVSDSGNQCIRYIDIAAGTVTTVAGSSKPVYAKDALYVEGDYEDGTAGKAKFDFPKGLALTAEGGLLIADSSNNAIRYLMNDEVRTIIGTSNGDFGDVDSGDRNARLHHPTDVAVAANGDIYIADAYNNKIKKISPYQLPDGIKKDGTIHVIIGQQVIEFDANPEKVNSRVMVPIRAVAETLGYEVEFVDSTIVSLSKGNTTITMRIGQTDVTTQIGTKQSSAQVDAAPYLKNKRTYVPIRFISELLGKQVDWLQDTQTVIIR